MKLPKDKTFDAEVERFRLKLYCEDCTLFDAKVGCAHGYPTEPHRKPIEPRDWVFFCKDFEAC